MELPRPEVTVTDPRSHARLVAVEEPPAPRLSSKGAVLLSAAALVGATALVAADAVRDRGDAVEQRRLDGQVEVVLADERVLLTASYDSTTGTGSVRGLVRLVNEGATDVRVLDAALGRMRAAGNGTTLEGGGGEAVVQLQRTVRCPAAGGPPPREPQAEGLDLRLDTALGPRDVTLLGEGLPLRSLDDSLQRACLHTPLEDSPQLAVTVLRTEGATAVLQVEVGNVGRAPVRLLSLVPSRGLVVESVGGDATGLPVVLPPGERRTASRTTLELRLRVVCSALRGADLLSPFEELAAIVEDEGRSRITSVETLAQDPGGQLRQLAGRTCSSG